MYDDLFFLLHPLRADEGYVLTCEGKLMHCSAADGKRKELGEASYLLTEDTRESLRNQDGTVEHSGKEDAPYKKGYIGEIRWPFMTVFQEYGTNGCVCNLETGELTRYQRGNYCSENSCFPVALFVYEGHICLLHGTDWNRLDITDLETGTLLTDRKVSCIELPEKDENGGRKYQYTNYLDYFHGRISFSPDGKYFVDAGWVWQPVGDPLLFSVEKFLQTYELSAWSHRVGKNFDIRYGDDWDQYAVWYDNEHYAFPYTPEEDWYEDCEIEEDLNINGEASVYLHFSVNDLLEDDKGKPCVRASLVEPIPFSMPYISGEVKKDGTFTSCKTEYPLVQLYFNREEKCLISLNEDYFSVIMEETKKEYSFFFGYPVRAKCGYSMEHNAVYQYPRWGGSYKCAKVSDVIEKLEKDKNTSKGGF